MAKVESADPRPRRTHRGRKPVFEPGAITWSPLVINTIVAAGREILRLPGESVGG
jgi:hypothetical protein